MHTFVYSLVDAIADPNLKALLHEHVEDNHGLLSHVFFGDVIRWLEGPATFEQRVMAAALIERGLSFGDDSIENLAPDSPMWSLLGPRTRRLE